MGGIRFSVRKCANAKMLAPTSSRVAGLGREHADLDADLFQGQRVFALGIGAEDELAIGRAVQPAVLVNLALELAGRPARIAEREHRAGGSVAARNRLEDVESGGETNALVDR